MQGEVVKFSSTCCRECLCISDVGGRDGGRIACKWRSRETKDGGKRH